MWWITTAFLVSLVTVFLEYRDWSDWNKHFFYRVTPGPCNYVTEDGGSEDATHIGGGTVLITSGFGAGEGKGTIKALNLNTSEVTTMKVSGAPSRKDFLTNPHGMSVWTDGNNQTFVYVVTHPSSGDTVEVFKVMENFVLKYKRTIKDPLFRDMNDLVMVAKDKFYITIYRFYSKGYMHLFEVLARRPWGGVLFYDGNKAKHVVSGLFMPNGINISKDKKTVFVSEFGRKQLLAFQRSAGNLLTKLWEVYSDTHVDNIEVDPETGNLWIGCHPVTYKIYDFILGFVGYQLPSQVLRYKMEDNAVSEIEEIYSDDGSELDGSTVAVYAMGKLVIGTITRQTLVCDVTYLSE